MTGAAIWWAVGGLVLGIASHLAVGRWFEPDRYSGRPYGWLTNQLSHAGVMVMALLALIVGLLAAGWEIPYRADLAVGGIAFAVAFQTMQWRVGGYWADCVEDAVFMGLHGWTSVIFMFRAGDVVELQPYAAPGLLLLMAWHLLIGVVLRLGPRKAKGN